MVWSMKGNVKKIVGPKLVRLYFSTIRFCSRHTANRDSQLIVYMKNGQIKNVDGPCSIYFDHLHHERIEIKKAIRVEYGEAIVVYTDEIAEQEKLLEKSSDSGNKLQTASVVNDQDDGKKMVRKIYKGPLMFLPRINQHIHEFSWHGESNASHPSQIRVLSGLRKFTNLPLLEQQIYYNVRDVKTNDSDTLTIKVMLFYTIVDITKMLDTTSDVVGDIINALAADVISWSATKSYSQILEHTGELSDLNTFKQLIKCAEIHGTKIGKVHYRGLKGSDSLLVLHDQAVRRRLELKSKQEEMVERERMEDLKLAKSLERAEKEQSKKSREHEHMLRLRKNEHEQKMEMELAACNQKINFYKQLKENGVNLTEFLVAESYSNSTGVSKQSMLHLNNINGNSSNIHVHTDRR